MRSLIIVPGCLFALLFVLTEKSQAQYSTNFKGSVKTVVTYYYNLNTRDTITWDNKFINTYNRQGQLTGDYAYGTGLKKDSVLAGFTYTYNADGKKIGTFRSGQIIDKTDYSYNRHHNLVETVSSRNGSPQSIRIYNAKGMVDTVLWYDVAGRLNSTTINHFTNNGNLMRQDEFKEDGTLDHTEIIKYDDSHNVLEDIRVKPNATRESRQTFKYDEKNNIIMRLDSNMFYIGNALPAQKITDAVYSYTFRYDKFDKAGNWVQQSYLIGGRFVLCAKREIEYY